MPPFLWLLSGSEKRFAILRVTPCFPCHPEHRTWSGFRIARSDGSDRRDPPPPFVAGVLYLQGGYRTSFAILLIPALLALAVLLVARALYPRPRDLEVASAELKTKGFSRVFWLYLAAVSLIGAGYVDFPLISYHFEKLSVAPKVWIPVFYAVAMGVDALSALFFGYLFDRIGLSILLVASLLSSIFAPFVFLGGFYVALAGMALWGVGMGAQESIMRAAIAGWSRWTDEARPTEFSMQVSVYAGF